MYLHGLLGSGGIPGGRLQAGNAVITHAALQPRPLACVCSIISSIFKMGTCQSSDACTHYA